MNIKNAGMLQETRELLSQRLAREGHGIFVIAGYESMQGGISELIVLKQVKPKGLRCFFDGMMAGDGVEQLKTRFDYQGGVFRTNTCTVQVVYGLTGGATSTRRYHVALLVTVNGYKFTKTREKKRPRDNRDCK